MAQRGRMGVGLLVGAGLAVAVYVLLGGTFGSPASESLNARIPERPVSAELPVLTGGHAAVVKEHPDLDAWRFSITDGSGRAIPGASIVAAACTATFIDSTLADTATSDTDGMALFPIPRNAGAGNEGCLLFTASGYVAASHKIHEIRETFASTPDAVFVVRLDQGGRVRGTVRDPWGQMLPGVRAQALGAHGRVLGALSSLRPGPRAAHDYRESITNARGEFDIVGIASFPVVVRCIKPHYVHYSSIGEIAAAQDVIDVTMHPYLRIGVRLIDSTTGQPVPAFQVALVEKPEGIEETSYTRHALPAGDPFTGPGPGLAEFWFTLRCTAGFDSSVEPVVRLRAQAPGYDDTEVSVPMQHPDRGVGAVDVQMERSAHAPKQGTLNVRFVTSATFPVGGHIGIALERVDEIRRAARKVSRYIAPVNEGNMRIPLPPGAYAIRVDGPLAWTYVPGAKEPRRIEIRSDEVTDVAWPLPVGEVRIRSVLPSGDDLPMFAVNFHRQSARGYEFAGHADLEELLFADVHAQHRKVFVNAPGEIRTALPPGHYLVGLADTNFASDLASIEVTDGETSSLTLAVRPK